MTGEWRYEVQTRDVMAVRALVQATGFFSPAEIEIAAELVQERLERGEASGYVFALHEHGGELRGYACWGPIPGTAASFDLYWVAVAPAGQRAGLGRALVRAAELDALRRGGRRMFVDTSGRAQYAPTRAFYERCGYGVEARLADFYDVGDDKVIFGKALAEDI
jgi:GNAT superfamily N-acetyltransferase